MNNKYIILSCNCCSYEWIALKYNSETEGKEFRIAAETNGKCKQCNSKEVLLGGC